MSTRVFKPNEKMLRDLVLYEAKKVEKLIMPDEKAEKDKVEVEKDSSKLKSLEKDVDFMKVLKIKESRLKKSLKKIQERIKRLEESGGKKKVKK